MHYENFSLQLTEEVFNCILFVNFTHVNQLIYYTPTNALLYCNSLKSLHENI